MTELRKVHINGLNRDSVATNVEVSNSNRLLVEAQPYLYAIAEGEIPGHDHELKFGTRTSVTAGVQSNVWEGPTAIYPYRVTATRLQINSDSANDTSDGTGARTLRIFGVDGACNEIDEIITMNGTTAVDTVASFLRIFRAYALTSGNEYTNSGTINIKDSAASDVLGIINKGDGQTLMAQWTVPADKTAYVLRGSVSTSSNKGAVLSLFARQICATDCYAWQIKYRGYVFSGATEILLPIPYVLPEKVDVEIRVQTPGSAGTTSVGGTFSLWYEDN